MIYRAKQAEMGRCHALLQNANNIGDWSSKLRRLDEALRTTR